MCSTCSMECSALSTVISGSATIGRVTDWPSRKPEFLVTLDMHGSGVHSCLTPGCVGCWASPTAQGTDRTGGDLESLERRWRPASFREKHPMKNRHALRRMCHDCQF